MTRKPLEPASAEGVELGTLTAVDPTIKGTAAVGQTLTAVPGVWGPTGVRNGYAWLRGFGEGYLALFPTLEEARAQASDRAADALRDVTQ